MPFRTTKLALLPDAKWDGHLTILRRQEADYAVEFDAVDPKARAERHVMDRTVLTPEQLFSWTGYKETD